MRCALLLFFCALCVISVRAEETELSVDFSVPAGKIRALHGINKGPLVPGGIINVLQAQKELGVPFTRLHDCGWPNPYVVDHHVVFPDPKADPALPESYDFRLTDEYLAAVRQTGSEPIYRLGESIEHTSVKRYVHPPADPQKWAAICLGIIRHYNEGWAKGFHYNIHYWEIWNEPDSRPSMWSGTDDDYLALYRTAARAIKKEFPALKVGGPALGSSGSFVEGEFQPTEFATRFLAMCRQDNVPLNFFSWHCYTSHPSELGARSRAIRRLLDSKGFTDTENHLNEWNYLPGDRWQPLMKEGAPSERQRAYEEMAGPAGAAFAVTSLLELQDAPVDVANFFHGEAGPFGLFSEQGVPLPAYYALRIFHGLLETPRRVETTGAVPGKLGFAAGLSNDGREATIVVSNYADGRADFALRWQGFTWTGGVTAEVRIISADRSFTDLVSEAVPTEDGSLRLTLPAPAVAMIRLRPTQGAKAQRVLAITTPANRLVFQRDHSDRGSFPVAGTCAWPGAVIEARLVEVESRIAGAWMPLGAVQPDLQFHGRLNAAAGWYSLEIRARGSDPAATATATVQRVGVGEVFVVVGHSVAHGGLINLPGASDDRVDTIALPSGDQESQRRYKATGDASLLPELVGHKFGSDIQPAPAGNGTYFWAEFAQHVAEEQKVPVLLFNAAFGGTSLEHWAKSARGESFDHPFVRSAIRMPYIRLEHALTKYCSVIGLRAILADQGQNDWPEKDETKIVANYQAWIAQARHDAGAPHLAIVVNRQSPPDGFGQIRRVQNRIIEDGPDCFPGPDYDTLAKEDTVDKVHLSEAGERKAARMWADALTPDFFRNSEPLLPKISE